MKLEHSDIASLERTIDGAYSVASKRLLDIFFDDYKLVDHLVALKKYLLLCAGDFADTLLQAITPRLNREASKLLRHHLTGDIDTAVQGSLAKNEPHDIVRRIDATIGTFQPGDIGWQWSTTGRPSSISGKFAGHLSPSTTTGSKTLSVLESSRTSPVSRERSEERYQR